MTNLDDLIKEFEEKAKNAKSKYEFPKDKDEIYDVDIQALIRLMFCRIYSYKNGSLKSSLFYIIT